MSYLFFDRNLAFPNDANTHNEAASAHSAETSTPEAIITNRKRLGLSQQELAEGLGVSIHTVQSWEQGRREPRTVAVKFMKMLFGGESGSTPTNQSRGR